MSARTWTQSTRATPISFMHYGIASCKQAIEQAGLEVPEAEAHRFGVFMGSGIGGLDTIQKNYERIRRADPGESRRSSFRAASSTWSRDMSRSTTG